MVCPWVSAEHGHFYASSAPLEVPSIPWSGDGLTCVLTAEGEVPDDVFQKAMVKTVEDAMARAEHIGFPLMVKALTS